MPPDSFSTVTREHIEHPRNQGRPSVFHGEGIDENPVCGDVMTVWITVEAGIASEVAFEARGCRPSIAAGSAVTEMLKGKSLERCGSITAEEVDAALGGLPRIKRHCAFLAARAARNAADDYRKRRSAE